MKKLCVALVLVCAATGWGCSDNGGGGGTGGGGTGGGGTGPSALPPTVAAISPASGPTTGNTAITITGSNFVAGATVTIAGVPATNVSGSGATLTARTGVRLDVGPSEVVVTNPDGQVGRLANGYDYRPVLVANPGSGYSVDAERDIVLTSAGSSSHPFPITHFFWDCGQGVFPHHRKNCQPDTPSPEFRYRKEGFIRDGPRDYTVTLIIEDARGNRSAPATTTVRVRMVY